MRVRVGVRVGGQTVPFWQWMKPRMHASLSRIKPMRLAIEAKAAAKVTAEHLRGLRALIEDHPRTKRRMIVCLESKSRITEDRIEVLTAKNLCTELATGRLP